MGKFLALVVVCFSLGCATLTPAQRAFGAAYGACMEAQGLAAVPSVGSQVLADLDSGMPLPALEQQLVALAAQAGEAAVSCAASSYLTIKGATPTAAPMVPGGIVAARHWLALHGGGR